MRLSEINFDNSGNPDVLPSLWQSDTYPSDEKLVQGLISFYWAPITVSSGFLSQVIFLETASISI